MIIIAIVYAVSVWIGVVAYAYANASDATPPDDYGES